MVLSALVNMAIDRSRLRAVKAALCCVSKAVGPGRSCNCELFATAGVELRLSARGFVDLKVTSNWSRRGCPLKE
jgi:hypothetical protein